MDGSTKAQAAGTAKLVTRGVAKSYGPVAALQPTDLHVGAGELMTVLGPSGSGKTTLLQIIAGLVEPTAGRILIDGNDHTHTPVHRRDIGVVFQSYALFPHLTVAENIGFPLRMRGLPAAELARRVRAALAMVQLGHLADRPPRALSGGQQQRVALARCFVYQPSIILMDEPLGALDRKLREHMQVEIKHLHRESGATILYVTHDQEEALAISDRICLMNQARVEQIGSPRQIYEAPASIFAAEFIGISNVLRGRVGSRTLRTPDGEFALPAVPGGLTSGAPAALVVRPENVQLADSGHGALAGEVVEHVYAGSETRLLLRLASRTVFILRLPAGVPAPAIGAAVGVRWPDGAAVCVPA